MSRWTYTFCDALTGIELATLPMTGVSYSTALMDVGQLQGVVPTLDAGVRALDPWAATTPRRTLLYVECDDVPVWGGIVTGRARDQGTWGLKVSAATFEHWLTRALLWADVDMRGTQLGAPSTFDGLVYTVQSLPNGQLNLFVDSNQWPQGAGGDGTGESRVPGQLYPATDLKSLADYLKGWQAMWGVPIEWRVDVARSGGMDRYMRPTRAAYLQTLLVTEDTLADSTWSCTYPGTLLAFTDTEDATTQSNAVLGSASGAANVPMLSVQTAPDVGSDEFAAGYPLWASTYSASGSNTNAAGYATGGSSSQLSQAALDSFTQEQLLDRLVQGHGLTALSVQATPEVLQQWRVGHALDLELTHPAYPEWPGVTSYSGYRITGKHVTVGEGTTPDAVSLDVVPPANRLPSSVTMTATIQDMLDRLRRLEVPYTSTR